jgi:hypothetical protein
MSEISIAFMVISILGGLYYFWVHCQMFAVSKLLLVMGILIWPLGAVIGIFWGIQDFIKFRANK